MTQTELEQEIAHRTGESLQTIRSLGFGPLQPIIPFEERVQPLVVDWDLEFQTRFSRGSI